MSICFYTITPQPEQNPVAYIFRLFYDKDGFSFWFQIKTSLFCSSRFGRSFNG